MKTRALKFCAITLICSVPFLILGCATTQPGDYLSIPKLPAKALKRTSPPPQCKKVDGFVDVAGCLANFRQYNRAGFLHSRFLAGTVRSIYQDKKELLDRPNGIVRKNPKAEPRCDINDLADIAACLSDHRQYAIYIHYKQITQRDWLVDVRRRSQRAKETS